MTQLILVRHAEAQGNVDQIFHGWTDSELTDKGIRQARKLAERLSKIDIDVIYSSDLKRAINTANFIADIKNLDVNIKRDLREINAGEWEDISFDRIDEEWPEQSYYMNNQLNLLCPPNGESVLNFNNRILTEINNIILQNLNKNICVVTHGTAIRLILCYYYNRPIEEVETIIWGDNTSVSIIKIDNDEYYVEIENDNTHLGDELSTLSTQDWWLKYKK